ncbi:alpha/beta fold hydrolase [Pengzhenrongella frigida]|uniref:Alpha/beta fold hydrolase n=1 Tax=Pengzhenrongella frigida TaxID=1259133 RepID=A0A4Q5MYB7_9MICO|nr:alpha/beta hydrolase [Cellulomonas sp. HLT2-17]RYV50670.1 alpha/beta fold hydrolase [Cellulomonas sp. HLT2-17]
MTIDGLLALHTYRTSRTGRVPLVLLHGYPVDHRMWDDVVDLLPGDRTVVAPDLPGLGVSPSGQDVAAALGRPAEPSLETAADAVAATLRAAGIDRAVVAGLSMGGYVAMALVERHPDLVAGLGLLDTKSTADDAGARANRLRVAAAVQADATVDAVLGMRRALLGETSLVQEPDLVDRLERWIRSQGPGGIAWSQRAMAVRPDRTDVLAGFGGPALVVIGAEDTVTPLAAAQHLVGALPQAELVVVPRAGHLTSVENPEPVAAALDALALRVDDADRAPGSSGAGPSEPVPSEPAPSEPVV